MEQEIKMKKTIAAIAITLALAGSAFAQSADQLEAQFTTCDKHHIPSNLCTLDIANQLANKDRLIACLNGVVDLAAAEASAIPVYEETLRLKPHDAFAEKIISEYRASLAIPMKDKQAKCYTESKETK
jgi:hypothetical protein